MFGKIITYLKKQAPIWWIIWGAIITFFASIVSALAAWLHLVPWFVFYFLGGVDLIAILFVLFLVWAIMSEES